MYAWTKQKNIILNPAKPTCTLFTPDPAEYTSNQDLTINNKALRMAALQRYLPKTLVANTCPPQNKFYLHQIILTQSGHHNTSITTMPTPCNLHIHYTHHLFNCTNIRTTLSRLDLWTDSDGVMDLLARWMDKLAGGPKAGSPHKQRSREWVQTTTM